MSKWDILEAVLAADLDTIEQRLRELRPTRSELTGWLRAVDHAFAFRCLTADQIYQKAAVELRSGCAGFLD